MVFKVSKRLSTVAIKYVARDDLLSLNQYRGQEGRLFLFYSKTQESFTEYIYIYPHKFIDKTEML